MEPITKSSEKKMMKVGDKVAHWNLGRAIVIEVPHGADDVPQEWKHDWAAVVRVRGRGFESGGRWVLAVDLEKE